MDNKTDQSSKVRTYSNKLQNLGLMALAVFYIAQFGMDIAWKNMCGQLAIDYCSFWSAGTIANRDGYAEVYNLEKMKELQLSVFPGRDDAMEAFATVPTPYLPPFIVPFQILAFLGPFIGFWVWTFINLTAFILYLRFFTKQITNKPLENHILILMTLSLPIFLNLFYGQVNFWLTICIGEFIRATTLGKYYRAGLWLAGLLLKPQFLVLIGLALLIQQSIKILTGFSVGFILISAISVIMAGADGMLTLIRLWLGYTSGLPTNNPEVMMNWRMVGINLTPYFGSTTSWIIAGLGMAVTLILFIYIWKQPIEPTSSVYVLALSGTFAATNVLAWHSHISSATILIPPMIYLLYKINYTPKKLILSWVFVPPAFRFAVFIMSILVQEGILSYKLTGIINFSTAISMLALNVYILVWAVMKLQSHHFIKTIKKLT